MAQGYFVQAVNRALAKGYTTPEDHEGLNRILRKDLCESWKELLDTQERLGRPQKQLDFVKTKIAQFS